MRRYPRFLLPVLCLIALCEAVGSQQPPRTVTLRPRAAASSPGAPQVRVRADQQRVPVGTIVTFTISPARVVTDNVVTLYFGDGRKQVMSGPQTVHAYEAVGNYTYSVEVKPRRQCEARVALNSSAQSIQESEPVTFSAKLSGNCSDIQYRFVFGEGSPSVWRSSPQAEHRYARAGNYFAYVDIGDGKSRLGGSQRLQLNVTRPGSGVDPRSKVAVSLTTEPSPARSGTPVTFTAKASPARAGTRYQFNFGDGERTLWQTDSYSQHTYKTRGIYRPSVQVSQLINNQNVSATSAPAILRVGTGADTPTDPDARPTPTPPPTPDTNPSPTPAASPAVSDSPTPSPGDGSSTPSGPGGTTVSGGDASSSSSPFSTPNPVGSSRGSTWWYLLIAAVILFLIYQASGLLFVTQPTFAPFTDPGVAAVAPEKGVASIGFQLVLDPNVSGGDYSVTTDQPRLVMNAPEPEERQTFEI